MTDKVIRNRGARIVVASAGIIGVAAMLAAGGISGLQAREAGKATWSYHGENGPENWGKLSAEYAMCAKGRNQSPVDIVDTVSAELKPLAMNYEQSPAKVLNSGHTIKVSLDKGGELSVDGGKFRILQFHFHSPSENKVNGKHYPMEVHMVHMDEQGNLAVVGVFFREGKENNTLKPIFDSMPMQAGTEVKLAAAVNAADLLPADKGYYRFSGSLTTPPCTEGVRWLVMQQPLEASKEQIAAFRKAMGDKDTNRPVQPLNARKVMQQK